MSAKLPLLPVCLLLLSSLASAEPMLPPAADSEPAAARAKPANKPKPAQKPVQSPAKAEAISTGAKQKAATNHAPPASADSEPAKPAAPPTPIIREFRYEVTVDATQDWHKNDPEFPGDQYSKGWTKQKYELVTRLKSDGKLYVRNLLDSDLDTRLEAKIIHLARQAVKLFSKPGQPFVLPTEKAEQQALIKKMQAQYINCNGDAACLWDINLRSSALMAAFEYPQALEEDHDPGRYYYFEPYESCPEYSRLQLQTEIEGVRYNKTSDKFVPFKETHQADTVDASDGLRLCKHFLAVIDTEDPENPMWQETVFVPRPFGLTTYTESGHTSHTKEPQPMPTAVTDWMTEVLRTAPERGTIKADLPIVLPLNGNATWLGKFKGVAKTSMKYSFDVVD